MEVLTTSVKRTATKRKNMFGFGTPKALSPRQTTAAHGGIASHARKPSKRSASSASSEIKGSYRGYSIARDEAGEYYSSLDSGSRFETLAAVKKHIDWYLKARGNPAKFDRCVKAVKAKGGAYDPYAVCTAAGTRGNRKILLLLLLKPSLSFTAMSQTNW